MNKPKKKSNHNYPYCHLAGRLLTIPVTTTRNIPWVELLFLTLRNSRLQECVSVAEGTRGSCCSLSYGLEGTDFGFRQGQGTFLFSQHSRPPRCETQPASYSVGTEITGLLALGKGPGHEYDHSPPSSAEFKNEWSYNHTSPIRLHSTERDNSSFYIFFFFYNFARNWRPCRD